MKILKNLLKLLLSIMLPVTVLIIISISLEKNLTSKSNITLYTGNVLIVSGIIILSGTISSILHSRMGTLALWSLPQKLITPVLYLFKKPYDQRSIDHVDRGDT